ncbi:MAG: 3-methyl-2-oxobutanoate hydroxymethyltransferase [Candidatus Margulisiibacteriota bacterium]
MNTISTLKKKLSAGEKLTMLTAYDHTIACLLDKAGIDIVLVGDSLGMVVRGEENTLGVTIDDMVYHTKMVKRGLNKAFLVADMPFMSYQVNPESALINAGRLISEGGARAVKLEGGSVFRPQIEKIIKAGIPVMGHLGFTPQSVNQLGGYKIQGKSDDSARCLMCEAKALEEAGVFALVLEMVPAAVAADISKELSIPVIGCGAGPDCDGQVLVTNDILGLYSNTPKFAKQYINLRESISNAVGQYIEEVRGGKFPCKEHCF